MFKWLLNFRVVLLGLGVLSLTATGSYLLGRIAGKQAMINVVQNRSLNDTISSKREADAVRKEEQSISDIDRGLCRIGIMRANRGCE